MKLQINVRIVPVSFAAITAFKIKIFRQSGRTKIDRTTVVFANIHESYGARTRRCFATDYPESVFHTINLSVASREGDGRV
jgi:hypothetical protein